MMFRASKSLTTPMCFVALGVLLGCGAKAPPTSPVVQPLGPRFAVAFSNTDRSSILRMCSESCLKRGPCEELERSPREGVTLRLVQQMPGEGREVLVYDYLREGQVRDRIWVYVDEGQVSYIDESPKHAEAFVAGRTAAMYDFESLKNDEALMALGAELLGEKTEDPVGYALRENGSKAPVRAIAIPGSGVGAVCFDGEEPLTVLFTQTEGVYKATRHKFGYGRCSFYVSDFFGR